ncbi:hypothetical protein OIV83_004317 [Microbotryomycetes sp. JL201]|nr:hypothetical protein OIV83_004309 [Microbotryomycetes sp. JL201]KAK4049170.1 hypothetical protein OIV83_004317 [Microbotryomycetes sp. JL201]
MQLAGLAPGPYCGMVLADFGADVVRVDRLGTSFNPDTLTRHKRSLSLSVKSPAGVQLLQTLLSSPTQAGCSNPNCKPGVLERLGLGPDKLLQANPRLIIARLTGFRRDGPYSMMAGHDLNYIALSGVLSLLGRRGQKPYFPANILADFAGGGLMAAMGVLMAIIERHRTGLGQVVEADMVGEVTQTRDILHTEISSSQIQVTGARYVSSFPLMLSQPSTGLPLWDSERGDNFLDGGAPWYEVYETKDGLYMTVAALENHFYATFLNTLLPAVPRDVIPASPPTPATQMDRSTWPALSDFFTKAFLTKTRDEWTRVFVGTDSCCVPVLNRWEVDSRGVGKHEPGFQAASSQAGGDGGVPNPAPILSRTPAPSAAGTEGSYFLEPGSHTRAVLEEAGLGAEIGRLVAQKAVSLADSDDDAPQAKL